MEGLESLAERVGMLTGSLECSRRRRWCARARAGWLLELELALQVHSEIAWEAALQQEQEKELLLHRGHCRSARRAPSSQTGPKGLMGWKERSTGRRDRRERIRLKWGQRRTRLWDH